MTKQDNAMVRARIQRLESIKQQEIDMFIGKCEAINDSIRHYRQILKNNADITNCSGCKYKPKCNATSEEYGIAKWNGGCIEYEPK